MDINDEIINKELDRIGIPLDHEQAIYFRDGVKFAITKQLTLTDVVGQSEQFYCVADNIGAAGDCTSQCESCKNTGK